MSQPGPFGPQPAQPNPYQSSGVQTPFAPQFAAPAFKPIDRLQYMRMYQYIFENPNWMMNILLPALCGLIPVIGPLVLLGYQYEVVIALLGTGGLRYPDFDFNRFVDYLLRGLWPFLVQLIASVILVPLYLVLVIPMMLLMGAAGGAGDDAAPIIFLVGMAIFMVVIFAVAMLLAFILMPMQLRAGLTADFAQGFNFGWAMSFVKKTWVEILLGLLFLMFTSMVLGILGALACYIGIFFVMPLIFLAQAHFLYELYLLFLSRGGEPVPIKLQQPPAQGGFAPPKAY